MAEADAARVEDEDFSSALRAAVESSGKSLASLVVELADRGHVVTAATLSYWQSGRRRPGRHRSADVVRALEEILGTDSGGLLQHLTGPRVRGRGVRERAMGSSADPYAGRMLSMLNKLGQGLDTGFNIISLYERIVLDSTGAPREEHLHQVIRAQRDYLDAVFMGQVDVEGTDGPGTVSALSVGSVGGYEVDREMRLMAVRIDLPAPLRQGDVFMLDFSVSYPPGGGRKHGQVRAVTRTIREHVMEVEFAPDFLPAKVDGFLVQDEDYEHLEALARPVPVNDGIAQRVLLDVPPGDSGLRWLWPDERVEELDPRLERVASPAILRAWQEWEEPEPIERHAWSPFPAADN